MADPSATYCTLADLKAMFGEREVVSFCDKDGEGVEDSATVTFAIDAVSSEIDSYVGQRYELPLTEIPVVLTRYACDMVRYVLFGDAMTKVVAMRYDQAIKYLEKVASGDIPLGSSNSDNAVSGVQYDGQDRVLTRDNLEVW